jgi:hypothetical protein
MGSDSIYVHPEAWRAIKRSPGDVRQRLRRAISELASTPRPPASKQQVLAVRQRPPYDYRDLEALVKKVEEP